MKTNYFSYILFIILLLPVTSCTDWLNLTPDDELVSSEFWKSQDDVDAILADTYGVFATQVTTLLLWGELRGGLISEGQGVPTDAARIITGDITDDNSYDKWSTMYKVIDGCNQILTYAPGVVDRDPSFTPGELKEVKAEALFLRALSYFYLVRVFKEVPLILEAYVSDDQDYYPEKTTEDVILDQIVKDLTEALDGSVTTFNDVVNDKGRATIYAVHALLADVYLWRDDYANAIIHCDAIINNPGYGLMGANSWFQNFYPGNSNSSIFEIQFDRKWGYSYYSGLYSTFSYQRNRQFIINSRILEIFDPDDVRGAGATYSENHFEIWKYIGINPTDERGDAFSDNNFIIYRLADIYLLKAEALAEQQQFTESLEMINTIRRKRNVGDAVIEPTITAFEDAILEERSRELAIEGKYWFDLIRFGKRDNYRNKDKVINALTLNAAADEIPALTEKFKDPYSWYLPIYKDELSTNTKLVQNPYYKN